MISALHQVSQSSLRGTCKRSRYDSQGHTLLELLAAMTITVLLILMITQIMSAVMGMWIKGKGRIRKNMDARSVLELMVQDLQSIVIAPSAQRPGFEWFQRKVETGLQNEAGYNAGNVSWLMFFSVPVDRSTPVGGDLTAVSYRLGYEQSPVVSGIKLFGLYRTLIPPPETFTNILGKSDLLGEYWNTGPVDSRKAENFLIANIVEFRTTFRVQNPDGSFIEIPSSSDVRLGDGLVLVPPVTGVAATAKLHSADLMITLISEEGYKRLSRPGVNFQNILLEHTHTYTRRVALRY